MAPKIALADVTKTYQVRGRPVTALRGVSLDVADGEFLCMAMVERRIRQDAVKRLAR